MPVVRVNNYRFFVYKNYKVGVVTGSKTNII